MNRIVKNASWIIGCKIAETIFMLVVTALQARIFGPTNFGLITYAQSIVTILVPVMQMGLNSILIKEIVNHKNEEGKIVGTALLMALVMAPIAIVIGLFYVSFINVGSQETIIVCFLYSLLLIFQVFELLQYWFFAHYMSKYTALTVFGAYVIASIYKLCVLFINKSVYYYAVAQAVYYAVIAIALLYFFKKKCNDKLSFDLKTVKYLFSRSKYFMISSIAVTIYTQLDRVILKNVVGDTANGLYGAAITIVNMATFIFVAIIDSTQPDLIEKHSRSKEEFNKGMTKLYSVVFYLSLLMCVGVGIFAPIAVNIMYGAEYYETINLLRIVVWYGMFSFIGIARNVYIVAENKDKYIWIISILGAIFSVITNYLLISKLGATGAAISAILIQIFVNVILGFVFKGLRENNQLLIKSLNPKILINMVKDRNGI